MNFNGFSFPHPILGLGDEITGLAQVDDIIYDEVTDSENYNLTINYNLDNPDIINLINNQKAAFFCELTCSSTVYRQAELSFNPIQQIKVAKDAVRGKVDMLFLVLANSSISNYTNSQVHADYNGFQFAIDQGDILAYCGEGDFIAGIVYEKLRAVSSFMEVMQGEHSIGELDIILESNKIQVLLSKTDFELYSDARVGKNLKYASTFHSSIALPALIHALYQLKLGSNKDELKERPWAQIIEHRIQNDPLFNSIQLEEDNIIKIAQILLGLPLSRLLADLQNIEITVED